MAHPHQKTIMEPLIPHRNLVLKTVPAECNQVWIDRDVSTFTKTEMHGMVRISKKHCISTAYSWQRTVCTEQYSLRKNTHMSYNKAQRLLFCLSTVSYVRSLRKDGIPSFRGRKGSLPPAEWTDPPLPPKGSPHAKGAIFDQVGGRRGGVRVGEQRCPHPATMTLAILCLPPVPRSSPRRSGASVQVVDRDKAKAADCMKATFTSVEGMGGRKGSIPSAEGRESLGL